MEADVALRMGTAAAHSDVVQRAQIAALIQTLALTQVVFAVTEAILAPADGIAAPREPAIPPVDNAAVQDTTVRKATSAYL
jgi:hypothetical protein